MTALSPRARRWAAAGAWVVATLLIVIAFRAVGWHRTVHALRQASAPWLGVAMLCNLAIIALWAWQCRLFLPNGCRVSYGRMFEVTALTTTATNTVPAFLGQATGVAVMAERAGIGVAASLSVLAQHQMVEGIAKLAMLFAAAHVAPLPSWMHRALVGLAAGVALLAIGLLTLAYAPTRWRDRFTAFRSPGKLATGLAIALAMKGAEAAAWFAVERAFHVSPAPGSPLLALGAVNLASSLSASPGNLGVYEAAGYFAYVSLHVPKELAFALAVAGHLCYLVPLAGTGWIILSWRQLRTLRALPVA